MNRSQCFEPPLSLILLDIDNFKQFNAVYEQAKGDHVLAQLGQALTDCARREEMAFRYGGEELVVSIQRRDSMVPKSLLKKYASLLTRNLSAFLTTTVYQ